MTPQLLEVRWIDSTAIGESAWMSIDEVESSDRTASICHTVGYLHSETDQEYVLFGSVGLDRHGEPDQWGHGMVIPKVAVRLVRQLHPQPESYSLD